MENRKIDSLDLSPEASDQLSRMMSRIVQGDDAVIEGPLASVPNIEKKFKDWFETMQLKIPLLDVLLNVENSNQDKFGPRSIALPWKERKPGTLAYFETEDTELPKIKIPQAVARLRPLSLDTASDYIKRTTNSGYHIW
jgi:hypothetical protein